MRISIITSTLLAMLVSGCVATKTSSLVPAADVGDRITILGDLRRPIGDEMTIHGYKFRNGPYNNCFQVDTVDGKRTDTSRYVVIPGIGDWPEKTVATIHGYEVGTIEILGPDDSNFAPGDSRYKRRQSVFMTFRALEIVEPKTLKLGDER